MFRHHNYLWNRVLALVRLNFYRHQLPDLLAAADPNASLADRIEWLENIFRWIRARTKLPNDFDSSTGHIQAVRFKFVFHLLERNLEWKTKFAKTLRSVMFETSGLELFCQTGLVGKTGFVSESVHRFLNRWLPAAPREGDISELFARVFKDPYDSVWVENLPAEVIAQLGQLLAFQTEHPEKIYRGFQRSLGDALLVLSTRVSAEGLSSDIRKRLPDSEIGSSPFLALQKEIHLLEERAKTHSLHEVSQALKLIANCRSAVDEVFSRLEESGVSIGLVYVLENQGRALDRIEALLKLLTPNEIAQDPAIVSRFVADLISQSLAQRSVRALVRTNIHLLSRKIVERAGASGEHYITRTRAEYWEMLRSASGGGVVTVATTLVKFSISHTKLPLFFEGLFYWLNYSGSFLFMQFCGFTLATKQPAMTASALASKLRKVNEQQGTEDFVTISAQITRSHFAAALGNVGAVIPGAIAVDLIHRAFTGAPILPAQYAAHTLEALDPVRSLTIPFAALTGVLLWLSSVGAGWLENWFVYRELPQAIAKNRTLNALLGDKGALKVSSWVSHSISGIGGNLAVGFLLAFTPVIGDFFGLPMEVRHVTLSTGSLTFAASALIGENRDWGLVLMASLGIVFIGIMNFGVSFVMAILVANRACEVNRGSVRDLLKKVGAYFRQQPKQFFFAPR